MVASRDRLPGVRVERAVAESLPFEDRSFNAALVQLAVHFMADSVAGLREMRRVTKVSGVVAACVWDHAGGHGPLGVFCGPLGCLTSMLTMSPRAGTRRGHLAKLLEAAGLCEIEQEA